MSAIYAACLQTLPRSFPPARICETGRLHRSAACAASGTARASFVPIQASGARRVGGQAAPYSPAPAEDEVVGERVLDRRRPGARLGTADGHGPEAGCGWSLARLAADVGPDDGATRAASPRGYARMLICEQARASACSRALRDEMHPASRLPGGSPFIARRGSPIWKQKAWLRPLGTCLSRYEWLGASLDTSCSRATPRASRAAPIISPDSRGHPGATAGEASIELARWDERLGVIDKQSRT